MQKKSAGTKEENRKYNIRDIFFMIKEARRFMMATSLAAALGGCAKKEQTPKAPPTPCEQAAVLTKAAEAILDSSEYQQKCAHCGGTCPSVCEKNVHLSACQNCQKPCTDDCQQKRQQAIKYTVTAQRLCPRE